MKATPHFLSSENKLKMKLCRSSFLTLFHFQTHISLLEINQLHILEEVLFCFFPICETISQYFILKTYFIFKALPICIAAQSVWLDAAVVNSDRRKRCQLSRLSPTPFFFFNSMSLGALFICPNFYGAKLRSAHTRASSFILLFLHISPFDFNCAQAALTRKKCDSFSVTYRSFT